MPVSVAAIKHEIGFACTLDLRVGAVLPNEQVCRSVDLWGYIKEVRSGSIIAEPGTICVSAAAHGQIGNRLPLAFDDLGEQQVKNIPEAIRVYRVQTETPAPPAVAAPPLPDKPSIAVLPFQNISGNPEQEYFVDGMVEEIITALSRIGWLFVIARNSSFAYKGQAIDVKQVGREFGIRYVLEGSVRQGGNRVRITAQLIDAATGAHLWAHRFSAGIDRKPLGSAARPGRPERRVCSG